MKTYDQQAWRGLRGLFWLAATLILFTVSTAVHAADDQWFAQYWANPNLSGDPLLVRHEAQINHIWNDGSPAENIPVDGFSARWTRTVYFNTSGVYRFTATMDDGMRVWLDDTLIINSWNDSQVHTITVDRYLSAGDHHLRVEYYEATGGAIAQFSWALAGAMTTPNWRGEYFNNKELLGQPALVRDDGAINFDWGYGSPASGINADNFSVRWTRSLSLEPGTYRFTVTSDDGVRLWVNNQLVVDRWRDQTATTYVADVALSGGAVPVRLEYYENTQQALVRLSWERITGPTAPVAPTPGQATAVFPWQATYYNNTNLEGSPVLVRQEAEINHIWGSSSPEPNVVNADRFSVRWTATPDFPAGRYRFTTFVDGGVRLWVNDQLIIDRWQDPYQVKEWANVLTLPGGPTSLRLEFFEDVGLAEARLVVNAENGGTVPVSGQPAPPATGTGDDLTATVINARILNVRSGPGMEFEPIAHLTGGQTVNLTGYRSGGWVQVSLPDGRSGWVGGAFLTGYNYNDLAPWTGG